MARAKLEAITHEAARGLLRSRWSLAMTGLVVTLVIGDWWLAVANCYLRRDVVYD